ncbi:amino acid adenylation domain-containing protein [Treponema sp.]|uniref:amino acid adenylation domain-containing protein n=1 Tax=Treponema sp. TaxID=166 RepID=UPI0025795AED|nr:amino acid adenylation domain-containing protein [Treponema sp.]MBE6355221.1 amino acid adenylation domain-containing protein [Treponema sp.]
MKYTVLDYLEETAEKFPDKTAFADVTSSITWKELTEKAKALSCVIAEHFKPGEAVPVMTDKNVKTVTYFFAALYAGCFYSFFDATFPDTRLTSMFTTLDASHVIADRRFEKKLSGLNVTPVFTDQVEQLLSENNYAYSAERRLSIIDTDAVYANFTSGSTGVPKAVAVSHRSVIDFIQCFTETFEISPEENIANQAPFDFDVSVKDIFSAVFTGATVHLVPKMFFSMPVKLLDYLEERQITTLIWAVSALCMVSTLNGFSYKVPTRLKKIMFSGEVMPKKQLDIWKQYVPSAQYVNLYGPTEITCNCTYFKIPADADYEVLPIGVPFKNERVFLLDENDTLVTEKNTEGELCVSGTCVALGYINNEEKTASVFTQNPVQKKRFERIYRTGDLAKYGDDGLLYYIGRKDTQIKHMGHRIELGEIEGAVSKHPNITRTCCIFAENKITAFYTGTKTEKKEIVTLIKQTLPAYMVPSDFIWVKEFPMTKNGKTDKKALEAMLNESA